MDALPPGYEHFDATRLPDGYKPTKHGYAVYEPSVDRSANDRREYRLLRLDNGIEVMLVSDREADKAAASMTVRVGSMSDPKELPGLAHYCEHLLFQGSKRFPEYNAYDEYLSRNNGSSNADTGPAATDFYFDVSPKAFAGALDRFAGFFTSPLFREDCVDREVKAVDSEFQWRLQEDCVRSSQLVQHLYPTEHPAHHFQWGNIVTLVERAKEQGIDTRDALINWYNEHYSANLMKLCLLSNAKLDDLAKLAVKYFASVRNNARPPMFWSQPCGRAQANRYVHSLLVDNHRILTLRWPLEDQAAFFRTKPADFIGHLLSREGEGSLQTALKTKGWINGLQASEDADAPGYSSFELVVTLTPEGLEHRDDIAVCVFQALRLLQTADVKAFEPAFREITSMADIHYRFQEPGEAIGTVLDISSELLEPYSRSSVLSAQHLLTTFDAGLIKGVLDQLQLDTVEIYVETQAPLIGLPYDDEEPFFKVKYGIQPIRPALLQRCATEEPLQGVRQYPPVNPFVPQGLKAAQSSKDALPILIKSDAKGQLWFKRDAKFLTPETNIMLLFRVPLRMRTLRHRVLTRLYTDLIDEALDSVSYDAAVAGSGYAISCDEEGFSLSVSGYTSVQLDAYLERIVVIVKTILSDEQTFERVHDKVQRGYENFVNADAISQAGVLAINLIDKDSCMPRDKLAVIKNLVLRDVIVHRDALLHRCSVQGYVHGSTLRADALSMIRDVETKLAFEAFPASEAPKPRDLLLPKGRSFLFREHNTNPEDVNSALVMTFQICSENDDEKRVRVSWLADILSQPFFDKLRTEQQLGYIVQCHSTCAGGIVSLTFQIQTEWHPAQVEVKVLDFIEWARGHVAKLDKDTLEEHRQGLIEGWLETFKTMGDEASYNWNQIDSGSCRFLRYKEHAALLRKAKRADLLDLLDTCLLPSGAGCAQLSVHVVSQRLQPSWLVPPTDHAGLNELLATKPTIGRLREGIDHLEGVSGEDRWRALSIHLWPTVPDGVELIDDAHAFRNTLQEAPLPIAAPQQAALFPQL